MLIFKFISYLHLRHGINFFPCKLIHLPVFDTMMIPIKRHAIASSVLTYPSLELRRMLFIDHLILLRVLDAALDGRVMPSHGKRMKLVGLQHNISILGKRCKQYLLLYSLLLLPHVSVQMLSLLLNNAINVFEICNKILLGINR
jgi:hypothetical protein